MKLSEVLEDGRQAFYDLQIHLYAVEQALLRPSSLEYISEVYGVNAKDFTFDTNGCVVYIDRESEVEEPTVRFNWDEIMDIIEDSNAN